MIEDVKREESRQQMAEMRHDQSRSWPIWAIGSLLLIQAVGLASFCTYKVTQLEWGLALQEELVLESLSPGQVEAIAIAATFLPLAILTMLAAIGFLFLLRAGWLLAMITQALILVACLRLYLERNPRVIYPIMLSCIVLVLYLNSYDVRLRFHARPAFEQTGDGYER